MKFVVGTYSFLVYVNVDLEWKIDEFDLLAAGHHYGIALPASSGDCFIAKGGGPIGQEITTYQWFDKTYRAIDTQHWDGRFKQIHQIVSRQDRLYVANTFFNSLDYCHRDGNRISRFVFEENETDWNHVNSIFPFEDDKLLVMLHNNGRKDSEIVVMQHKSDGTLEPIHSFRLWDIGCHNVFVDDYTLIYNASLRGDVVIVDLQSQRVKHRIALPGHTKGLSVTDEYLIVGYSDHCDHEARKTSQGYLAVFDRRTFAVIAHIDLSHASLPHPIGNVNEVRCLSVPDQAHARFEASPIDVLRLWLASTDRLHQFQNATQRLATRVKRRVRYELKRLRA